MNDDRDHHPLHTPVIDWFDDNARDLPWRRPEAGAWGVMVSEFMLQQTPVSRVLPVYGQWLERWPTPGALAGDPAGEAVRAWGRLGYPRRALRLHAAATAIAQLHGGEVPTDHAELLALPGVGEYTAAAVASFAYGQRHAVLDTNVRRVFARAVTGVEYPPNATTAAERRVAHRMLPADEATAARWAAATMELGALICTARGPECVRCPIAGQCAWRLAGSPSTTARRAAARRTPAPTARSGAGCWPCCGRPRSRCRRRRWTPCGTSPSSAPGRWTAWSPTVWWSPSRTAGTGCPAECRAHRTAASLHNRWVAVGPLCGGGRQSRTSAP